jgi:hypothetical protein
VRAVAASSPPESDAGLKPAIARAELQPFAVEERRGERQASRGAGPLLAISPMTLPHIRLLRMASSASARSPASSLARSGGVAHPLRDWTVLSTSAGKRLARTDFGS